MAPTMRACRTHAVPMAAGIVTGSTTTPPTPVAKPVVKVFDESHRISESIRAS